MKERRSNVIIGQKVAIFWDIEQQRLSQVAGSSLAGS
jgi:hypothetical protein